MGNKGCDGLLANHILQKSLHDISNIVKADCSIWGMDGKCLASVGVVSDTLNAKVSNAIANEEKKNEPGEDLLSFQIYEDLDPIYLLVFHSEIEAPEIVGKLCVSQLESLLHAYRIRLDRNMFLQNLLLDNLLQADIYNQAKKLGIENEQRRMVFLLETANDQNEVIEEMLKSMYAVQDKGFVTSLDENHFVLIKKLEKNDTYEEVDVMAKSMVDMINAEVMERVHVSYGSIAHSLKEVSRSYKEAQIAMEVGNIFYVGQYVFSYHGLGIGRLIHQLPVSLCEMFLQEVMEEDVMSQLDEEALSTVNHFFENNLNISETARKLFIHRNTLVYRLEKIQKITGMDIRTFDGALTFKIALMVSEHLKFMRGKHRI